MKCNHARPFAHSPCFEMGRPEGPEGPQIPPCPNSMVGAVTLVPIRVDGGMVVMRYRPVKVYGLWTFQRVGRRLPR